VAHSSRFWLEWGILPLDGVFGRYFAFSCLPDSISSLPHSYPVTKSRPCTPQIVTLRASDPLWMAELRRSEASFKPKTNLNGPPADFLTIARMNESVYFQPSQPEDEDTRAPMFP